MSFRNFATSSGSRVSPSPGISGIGKFSSVTQSSLRFCLKKICMGLNHKIGPFSGWFYLRVIFFLFHVFLIIPIALKLQVMVTSWTHFWAGYYVNNREREAKGTKSKHLFIIQRRRGSDWALTCSNVGACWAAHRGSHVKLEMILALRQTKLGWMLQAQSEPMLLTLPVHRLTLLLCWSGNDKHFKSKMYLC